MLNKLRAELNNKGISGIVKTNILKHIMKNGSFMIPEIAESTGYSLTTIAKYVNELQEQGTVIELEHVAAHGKGRRAVRYGISLNSYYFMGVDIKTFELNMALMDLTGNIVHIQRNNKFVFENTRNKLEEICVETKKFIDNLPDMDPEKIVSINMNISGRVDSLSGTSASVFNFEDMQTTPLAEFLSEKLGRAVFIENDTKAMAYGEYMSLPRQKYENILFVNIGWGLGLGIIIKGELYYGKNGYSGEFGHVNVFENNVLCHCGKIGCLETEVSGNAIHRKLIQKINEGESSLLAGKVNKGMRISTDDIIEAAEDEDPLCIDLISQTATELGHQIAALINLFNPNLIIIGGNLSMASPYYFLQPLQIVVRKYSLKLMCQDVPIVTAKLGKDTGVIGACMIARSKIFNTL